MSAKKQGTWARLAARPGPNPLWLWPLAGYLWLGVAGAWASTTSLPWWQVLLGGLLLVPGGLLVGRVLIREAGRTSPEGAAAKKWAGRTAGGYFLVAAIWCAYATATNVVNPVDVTGFGVLAAAMLPLALMHAHVRAALLEHADHAATDQPLAIEARSPHQQVVEELAPTIDTAAAREWTEIISGNDLLGNPRVIGWKNTWCGFDVTVELDPSRDDTASSVSTKLARITGRAARRFKVRGINLREGAVRLNRDPSAPADTVTFKVATRDVLASDVPIEPVRGLSINEGVRPVRREDGEFGIFDIRDEHGITSGATRTGKSTYEWSVWRELLSTVSTDDPALNDVLVMATGGAKLADLVAPWLRPLADGRAVRPVLDYVTDQSWEETKRWLRVVATIVHIRQTAPMGVFERDRNKVIPLSRQPLVYATVEEADEVLKNPEAIDLPFTSRKSAGQIIQYIGSKGLSSRVIMELMLQGTTEAMMGPYAGSIKQNFLRRSVFKTELKVHGSWLLPTGSDVDTSKLQHKSMVLHAEGIESLVAAKAPYLDEDTVIPQLAIGLQNHVTTLEDYTQQRLIELLGNDYAGRWSASRTKGWREYFSSVGTFPSLEDATPPEVRAAVRAGKPAGDSPARGESPQAPRAAGTPGEKDGQKGRWFGGFFVPNLGGTVKTNVEPGGELSPDWQGTLDQIRGLHAAEPVRPVKHPVPEPLATIAAALASDTREFVTNEDLATIVGATDTLKLGKQLSAQGVPARKKGDSRGRLVAELRAAAAAWRRGETPTVSDGADGQ